MSRSSTRVVLTAVAAVAIVVVAVVWRHGREQESSPDAGADQFAAYCQEVADQRGVLAAAAAQGPTTGLLRALPSFEALRAKSPPDVADDWDVVVEAVSNLVDTLKRAGVDPSRYDRAHPPAGLTAHQRGEIDAAATRLGSDQTVAALAAVEQEARDVCHSPLTL